VAVANPSPIPGRYAFCATGAALDRTGDAVRVLRDADLCLVVDIADLGRLGHLARPLAQRGVVTRASITTYAGHAPPGPRMVDATAAATGELVYDLA